MEALKVSGLSFSYGGKEGRKVLSSLDLSVEKGEFLTVLGPNGSGKSTLAKLLSGLLMPTEGRVEVNSLDTSDEKNRNAIRRLVGIVFQNPDNQIVGDTVEEDTAFGPENLGLERSEIARRVDSALESVDALSLKSRSPQLLSGGQKQRVAIAGVLALEGEVLILDESTSMLDPEGRREVMENVSRLNREKGLTVILVTHHAEECLASSRTIVIDKGGIVKDGKPSLILSDHRLLSSLGLDIPFEVEISLKLKERGIEDFPILVDRKELLKEIRRRLC